MIDVAQVARTLFERYALRPARELVMWASGTRPPEDLDTVSRLAALSGVAIGGYGTEYPGWARADATGVPEDEDPDVKLDAGHSVVAGKWPLPRTKSVREFVDRCFGNGTPFLIY